LPPHELRDTRRRKVMEDIVIGEFGYEGGKGGEVGTTLAINQGDMLQ